MTKLKDYAKKFSFAIKNNQALDFIDVRWQFQMERWRRKRKKEYFEKVISADDALEKLFPSISNDYNLTLELEKHMTNFIQVQSKKRYPSIENPYPVEYDLDKSLCRFLFFLCKLTNPDLVVETGVANGFSSSYILLGLDYEKNGELISIDYLFEPWHTERGIGMAIPNTLRKRHKIIFGKSIPTLKKLLINNAAIDIFIHDSLHTYKNMIEEYKLVWPYIKNGGFLLSDDVSINDAFLDFVDKIRLKPLIIQQEKGELFGLIQKKDP